MNGFTSYQRLIEKTIDTILESNSAHVQWLNTLSYLENSGARKIASAEHPIHVRKEMLQHAQEEFRHAYTLKRQIEKISGTPPQDYSFDTLLGGYQTIFFLSRLETMICRYIKAHFTIESKQALRMLSYLFTTYAIEKRAEELYRIYQKKISSNGSPISVAPIIKEEKNHLISIENSITNEIHNPDIHKCAILLIEASHTKNWLESISLSLL